MLGQWRGHLASPLNPPLEGWAPDHGETERFAEAREHVCSDTSDVRPRRVRDSYGTRHQVDMVAHTDQGRADLGGHVVVCDQPLVAMNQRLDVIVEDDGLHAAGGPAQHDGPNRVRIHLSAARPEQKALFTVPRTNRAHVLLATDAAVPISANGPPRKRPSYEYSGDVNRVRNELRHTSWGAMANRSVWPRPTARPCTLGSRATRVTRTRSDFHPRSCAGAMTVSVCTGFAYDFGGRFVRRVLTARLWPKVSTFGTRHQRHAVVACVAFGTVDAGTWIFHFNIYLLWVCARIFNKLPDVASNRLRKP